MISDHPMKEMTILRTIFKIKKGRRLNRIKRRKRRRLLRRPKKQRERRK